MTLGKNILIKILIVSISVLSLASCGRKGQKKNPKLILTEAPGNISSPDYLSGASWRYLTGARISSITLNKPGSVKVLTKEFYSACFPDISYDGEKMIFAGQKSEGDTWQIWEMNLGSKKYRQITRSEENCTDPAYLPGDRLVFSKLTINDTVRNSHCLYTSNTDGSNLRQITFSPESFFATSVLKDGRLLTIGTQTYPENGKPVLKVMRPDGTKADLFYKDLKGNNEVINSACETSSGSIVFAESDITGSSQGRLTSISYARPLHSRKSQRVGTEGEINYVLPLTEKSYLVSYRNSNSERYSVHLYDPSTGSLSDKVYSDPAYNITDIAVAEPFDRPRKLPSEVDMMVKTGLILCQDINFHHDLSGFNSGNSLKSGRIEIMGVDTSYGVVEVEEDGSFYLKILADKPFMIKALDENGDQVGDHCSWLWLRPNERRGCVGCHEDPEFVPDNKVSFAIKKDPVIVPVHITEIKEKTVELE